MMENPNNSGKVYCKKCQTYFEVLHKKCPFCGAPAPERVATAPVGPTATDLELFGLIKGLNEEQKVKLVALIRTSIQK